MNKERILELNNILNEKHPTHPDENAVEFSDLKVGDKFRMIADFDNSILRKTSRDRYIVDSSDDRFAVGLKFTVGKHGIVVKKA